MTDLKTTRHAAPVDATVSTPPQASAQAPKEPAQETAKGTADAPPTTMGYQQGFASGI